jgi:hypothetical protein
MPAIDTAGGCNVPLPCLQGTDPHPSPRLRPGARKASPAGRKKSKKAESAHCKNDAVSCFRGGRAWYKISAPARNTLRGAKAHDDKFLVSSTVEDEKGGQGAVRPVG